MSRGVYYDIEEKGKDKDKDEENEMNFNMSASTYARTQTSSPIGKPEQQQSCPENWSERFRPRGWKDNSYDSEDLCEDDNARNDDDIVYLFVMLNVSICRVTYGGSLPVLFPIMNKQLH